jgi:hypothetical protein
LGAYTASRPETGLLISSVWFAALSNSMYWPSAQRKLTTTGKCIGFPSIDRDG